MVAEGLGRGGEIGLRNVCGAQARAVSIVSGASPIRSAHLTKERTTSNQHPNAPRLPSAAAQCLLGSRLFTRLLMLLVLLAAGCDHIETLLVVVTPPSAASADSIHDVAFQIVDSVASSKSLAEAEIGTLCRVFPDGPGVIRGSWETPEGGLLIVCAGNAGKRLVKIELSNQLINRDWGFENLKLRNQLEAVLVARFGRAAAVLNQ